MFAKQLGLVLGLVAVAAIAPSSAAEPPPIFVGGQFIRQHAIEDERGHLLVPVRGVFEAFGASVQYTAPRIVVVRRNGAVIAGLVVGRHSAIVANRARYIDAAPVRVDGRVFVPLRSIAEIAGATVHYSTRPRLVDIRVPNNDLNAGIPVRAVPEIPPEESLPVWVYVLVGVVVLGFVIELARRIAAAAVPRPAKVPMRLRAAALPARPLPLQLPYSAGSGNQNGVGKIAK